MKENIAFLQIVAEGYLEGEQLKRARAALGEMHRAVDVLEDAKRAKEMALNDDDVLRKVASLLEVRGVLGRAEEHSLAAGRGSSWAKRGSDPTTAGVLRGSGLY